jgi:hypothetical protein
VNRNFLLVFFAGILLVFLTTTIFTTKNFLENDKATNSLKSINQKVKNILKKEMVKPKVRFSSFFVTGNNLLLETAKDYQVAYDTFSENEKLLIKFLPEKIKIIDLNLENRNSLPLLFDNSTQYFFYPLNFVKSTSLEEMGIKFKQAFQKNNYFEIKDKEINRTPRILNYFYIDLEPGNKILILLSAPRDPDPLYPNNKRQAIILSFQKKAGQTNVYSTFSDSFTLSNGD